MSAETLKFFEDKNTEEIINWMLSNLSEDQIRMCLDQSGIPDTSVIKGKGKEPVAAASASSSSAPVATMTLPDGSQKQLQPGEGTSSEPVKPKETKKDMISLFLKRYRDMCYNHGILVKSVTIEKRPKKDNPEEEEKIVKIEFYQFKEIDEDEVVVSPGSGQGDIGWVKKIVSPSEYSKLCKGSPGEETKDTFETLKSEEPEKFLNAPPEVLETSANYTESGLVPPIPVPVSAQIEVTPEPTPVAEAEQVEITEPMLKALKIQQKSSSFLRESYPDLFSKGLTMYPVFIYNSDKNQVLHLTAQVQDGKLVLVQDSTNKGLLNTKFKNITEGIKLAIDAGLYTPSGDMQNEFNEAQKDIPQDITFRISKIYDPIRLQGYTYFGTLEDEDIDIDTDIDMMDFGELDSMAFGTFDMDDMSNLQETKEIPTVVGTPVKQFSTKSKKISDMTIPEIEERMKIQFGPQYVKDYKPEKYVNSLGVTNVRYVKRTDCSKCPECPSEEKPKFTVFGVKPSLNHELNENEFGTDSDEELLFD
jgi:hypothetical protein